MEVTRDEICPGDGITVGLQGAVGMQDCGITMGDNLEKLPSSQEI